VNDIDGQIEALKAATIMIVDDEPTTIDVLEVFLQSEGYTKFVTTSDSRRALVMLTEERPDILLLNLMMPNVDGLEILSSIRNDEALKHIPVIILTSSTDAETKLMVLELGATDFLGKPVDPSELALRVRNTLAARAYRERLEWVRNGEKFALRLEEKLEAMAASWEAGDFEELVSLAQWLKGAAERAGFDAFSGPAATLELLAEERKEGEIEASIQELRGLAARIAVPGRGGARPGPPVVSRLAGKDPRIRAIIEKFAVRLAERLEAMEASCEAGDFDELASQAHWLRGAAGTVGFDVFTGPAGALKLLAKQRKKGEIETSIRELRDLAERIVVSSDYDT
jgi:DNA-binding response OmpR family regulator